MISKQTIKKYIPKRHIMFFQKLKYRIYNQIIELKKPKMIFGYKNIDGEFRYRTRISNTAYLHYPEKIQIADNVFVWHYSILDGTGGLSIDEGSQIGAWVGIFTHSSHIAIRIYGDHYKEVHENHKKGYIIDSVRIGKYVFIGAGSKILPGVKIGNGALISAMTLIKDDVEEYQVVAGNPAKVIGDTREIDKKYLQNDSLLQKWYMEWQKQ